MKYFLRHITQLNILAVLLLTAVGIVAWIPDIRDPRYDSWATLLTLLLTLANGACMAWMFYRMNITRFYTALPFVVYLFTTSAFPMLHHYWQGQAAILVLTPLIVLLYSTHLDERSQRSVFGATILLLLASVMMPALVWMLPVVWMMMIYQHALSLRSLLASFLAMVVFGIYAGLFDYFLGLSIPYRTGTPTWLMHGTDTSMADFVQCATCIGFGGLFMVLVAWQLGREGHDVRFATVVFSLILLLGGAMAIFPQPGHNNVPVLLYGFATLSTLFFVQRESAVRGAIFILLLVLSVVAYLL